MQCSRWSSVSMLGIVVAFAGCGGVAQVAHPDVVPAAGIVTYNGSPVTDADVTLFSPESKKGGWTCAGKTGADGTFTITTVFAPGTEAVGVPVGDYTAVVLKTEAVAANKPADMDAYKKAYEKQQAGAQPGQEPVPAAGPKSLVPTKYATDASSDLKVKIEKAGDLDIELKLVD